MAPPAPGGADSELLVALVGNPNAGKTTLFNALTGLRAKTANFPGTTIERRIGHATVGGRHVRVLDLPGLYSLSGRTPEERVARDSLLGHLPGQAQPDLVVLLVDATNLERNLYLASQVLELGIPTLVALNMVDLAERSAIDIDADHLAAELGCPVVPGKFAVFERRPVSALNSVVLPALGLPTNATVRAVRAASADSSSRTTAAASLIPCAPRRRAPRARARRAERRSRSSSRAHAEPTDRRAARA